MDPERREVLQRIDLLLEGEEDWVAAMATVACELHQSFAHFHWTGFYRVVAPELLKIGPYQGGHGCLTIPFSRGICGAAARTRETQLVPNVHERSDHIACASSTNSEIVVPVVGAKGGNGNERHADRLLAVLDVDSDDLNAFSVADKQLLEAVCAMLGERYGHVIGL
mmetsp:Transcript_13574/g.49359  ORF Transcript_13574/g.49359 Transcript_13574/m.49359 type:complete len:167 (+) Transcript_13574:40-540(+)